MSGPSAINELFSLYNPTYELEQQKAFSKHMRAMHRLSNDKNLEFITNEIYNNIIESDKKGERSHTTTIIEEGYEGELSGIYINEIKCNSNIDISGNYILDVFSNPILDISGNKLYSISGGELSTEIMSNITIQGEIDISGNNVVIDASNNVLFKVSGNKVLSPDNSEIATITEDTLSSRVLSKLSDKFDGITGGITGEITTPIIVFSNENSTPQNKSLVFDWPIAIVQLDNPMYELEQQKAFAKHIRAMHRLSNDKNLEYITNEIYSNIVESAKKSNQRSHTTTIIEEGYEGELSGMYFNEIKGNSNIDISGNYILDVFSNPILDISGNKLYSISGEALGQLLLSNMIIQGEIDISGNNVVVDASNNVLFKVSGNKVLSPDNSEIATITEDTLSSRVLSKVSDKFDGITGEIITSTPQNKSLVFDW